MVCAILRDEQSLHASARFCDSFAVEGSKGLASILPDVQTYRDALPDFILT